VYEVMLVGGVVLQRRLEERRNKKKAFLEAHAAKERCITLAESIQVSAPIPLMCLGLGFVCTCARASAGKPAHMTGTKSSSERRR
jgi:hypothetical protein